jgi:hypothetical protein
MTDDVNIILKLDASQTHKEMDTVAQKKDKLVKDWAKQQREITRQIARVNMKIHSVMGVVRASFRAIGQSMTPIQQAIVGAILTTLEATLAIHRTLEAGTLGVAGVVTVGLSATALSMSLAAVGFAVTGMEEAKRGIDNAEGFIASLQSATYAFGGF